MSEKPRKDVATTSGIPVEPVYRPDNLTGFDPARDLGEPGAFPFTRGIQPTMYRSRLWTMRQYAGMGDAEESNKRYKFLLAHGAGCGERGALSSTSALSVAFDLPTQIGYDSDSLWPSAKSAALASLLIHWKICNAFSRTFPSTASPPP